MIAIISPAKTLDYKTKNHPGQEEPRLLSDSLRLVETLKKKSSNKLQKLMSISKSIADLNVQRYKDFSREFTNENSKAALLAFKGDVYLGLDAESLNEQELNFAQDHLRILSGLYGLLRPMDKMQPYRLEMGTQLRTTRGKNLYEFWKNRVTDLLNNDLELSDSKYIINIASQEYTRVLNRKKLKAQVIDVNFKEERNGELKFISFNAKKARGYMARYIIQNQISDPQHLKGFDIDGYYFSEDHSTENSYLFIR